MHLFGTYYFTLTLGGLNEFELYERTGGGGGLGVLRRRNFGRI